MRMSARAYARKRSAPQSSIQHAIKTGLIIRGADGLIDSEQADRTWLPTRRAVRLARNGKGAESEAATRAKIAIASARLRQAEQKFAAASERYVDRQEAIEVGRIEATFFLDQLRASPDSPAAEAFAAELGIPAERGRAILQEFVELVLDEIGDLEAQAVADVARLP